MKVLVIYYSRTGVTRKAAEKAAELLRQQAGTEVQTEEILDRKDRKGILGWIGAGKDASLKRKADIEPIKSDVASFDLVIIGTPVWAWKAATPVRSFCDQHGATCRRAAFFCTMGGSGAEGAFAAMQSGSGREPVATLALIDRKVKAEDEEAFVKPLREFIAQALQRVSG